MAEFIANVQKLQEFPEGLHWFCPRRNIEDQAYYFDEDLQGSLDGETEQQRTERQERLKEAKIRKRAVLEALTIFAFNGAEAAPHQEWLKQHLEHLMISCDVCVRVFHLARQDLKNSLQEDYDEDDVINFLDKFDNMNISRISSGLDYATERLLKLPPEQRRVGALDARGIYAIFEVLSCAPYFQNEQLMVNHFDRPFQMVQTRKKLKLTSYLPALTTFLFSRNQFRWEWARFIFEKINRPPTSTEFDWSIRQTLVDTMKKVHMTSLQVDCLPGFWSGARTIVSHLNKDLITHSVRSLDVDIYKLALDHFHLHQLDTNTLGDLLATYKLLLELSPEDFWGAMKTISSATVIEQVFNSPTLERLLLHAGEEGMPELGPVFGWIEPFIDSIKPLNQTGACRSLVTLLITRSRNIKYSKVARDICLTQALQVLSHTLDNLNKGNRLSTFVGAAPVADMLHLVKEYIDTILMATQGVQNGTPQKKDTTLSLHVIEQSLVLDSLALSMDRDTVLRQKQREQANVIRSEALWNTIATNIRPGNQALATYTLLGAQKLLSLEPFGPKFISALPEDPKRFNAAYDAKCSFVCNILERLCTFQPYELAGLFRTPHTAAGVIATLLSSDNAIRQAAVEMLETLSDKTGRRDAIGYVLGSAYQSTLSALNKFILQVTQKRIFTPVSSMIKLCSDVADVLTNSQDGLLRAKDLDEEELKATEGFWKGTWEALVIVFEETEHWSTVGHDKNMLMDFCRDTMQFAESLFDGYSVFVSAVRDERLTEQENKKHAVQLLRLPKDTMNSMVKWLRLRDEFLADKIVKVISNLLVKLQKAKMEVAETTLNAIQAVTDGTTKTKLSFPQINELVQALEKHTGRTMQPVVRAEKKTLTQTTIGGFARAGQDDSSDLSDAHDRLIADSTRNVERFKKMQEQKAREKAAQAAAAQIARKNVIDQAAFKNRRQLEIEAKKKRDAEAIARAKALRGELAGGGSALGALGIRGKDHAAKGTGMMVSSDEDSDSEDDLDAELFGLTTKSVKKEKKKAPTGLATQMIPEPRGPVKIKRQVRSFKDMRARLAPDLSSLHKEMLSWDYFHTGDFPPGSQRNQYSAVPNSFRDPKAYKDTFQPLLILEAWQGLVKEREESQAKPYDVKIVTRSTVDAFVEVSTTLTHAENIEVQISEGCIVLLSKAHNPATASDQPGCLARVQKVARKKQFLEVLYRVVPGNKFMSSLNPNALVRGVKVSSMTTLEREYGALAGLQYYDLCDYILKAEPSRLLEYTDRNLEPFMTTYELNKAQAKAVKSALDNDAFTLIQGPPGSGKTKTIVAIVGALLTDTLRESGSVPIPMPKGVTAQIGRAHV